MKTIIQKLPQASVLVIGDIMLDTYYQGDAHRISPEAPVPVVKVEKTRHLLGGAANVALNIRALGGQSTLIGLIAHDFAGQRIKKLLSENGINNQTVLSNERPTTVKSRIFARNQQMLRFDEEENFAISREEKSTLLQKIEQSLSDNSVIILSDYDKGTIYQELIQDIKALTQAKNIRSPRLLIDPKPSNKKYYHGANILTPNSKESSELVSMPLSNKEEIIACGQKIMQELQSDNVLITLGADGMALFHQGKITHIKSTAKQVFDVTGAGDTVIATLATCLAVDCDYPTACMLASLSAGIVVEKVGSATASQNEILEAMEKTNLHIEEWV